LQHPTPSLIAALPEKTFAPTEFASLQFCIDAASTWGTSQNGIGVVILAGNVYDVAPSLELGSNVRIQGAVDGPRTTLNFTGPLCASDTEVSPVVHLASETSDVTVSHIDFTRTEP
jgi:hypothetical protein